MGEPYLLPLDDLAWAQWRRAWDEFDRMLHLAMRRAEGTVSAEVFDVLCCLANAQENIRTDLANVIVTLVPASRPEGED